MGENDREGVWVRRADMEQVDAEPIEFGAELGQAVQPLLGGLPVVAVGPIAAEFAQVG
jgi:hypothetical protein